MKPRRISFELVIAQIKSWVFAAVSKIVLILVYGILITKGLRLLYPEMGFKLYKIFPWMEDFEMTYSWDLALLSAYAVLFFSCFFWDLTMKLLLTKDFEEKFRRWGWPVDLTKNIIYTIGAIVILFDASVFYRAFNSAVWGQTGFSFWALLATIGYVTFVVASTFVSHYLDQEVKHIKKGLQSCDVTEPSSVS